jgi:hypothetical protein
VTSHENRPFQITNQLLYQLSYTGFYSVESAILAPPKPPFYTAFLYPGAFRASRGKIFGLACQLLRFSHHERQWRNANAAT